MLDDIAPETKDRVIVNSYHGSKDRGVFSRPVSSLEKVWNHDIEVGSYDDLLERSLIQAREQGRDTVYAVDIGSGTGALFKSFLDDPSLGSKTRQFLAAHPEMRIEMVGLTDAKDEKEFLTESTIEPKTPDLPNQQFQARNIHYTISAQQSLEVFLHEAGIKDVDLFTSIMTLTYMGPNVMRDTLQTMIHYLQPGGTAVVYGFADRANMPGFRELVDGYMHELDIRNVDYSSPASIKATLDHKGLRFVLDKGSTPEQEEEMLKKTEDLYVRLGVLDQEVLAQRRIDFESLLTEGYDRNFALHRRAAYLIRDENALMTKKANEMQARKMKVLDEIQRVHSPDATIQIKDRTILIQKKIR